MAIVTALQFNESSGAMICDEEYWFLRRRRSFFLDNLRNLLPEYVSEKLGIEAAYGGWGHPGFHEEVINRTRKEIEKIFHEGSQPENSLTDLENIAMIVRQAMQDTRQRKVNDMLNYLYGFGIDDLNRGYFEEDGKKFDIKQDAVKSEAKKIVTYEKKTGLTDPIFKNKAVVIGFDPKFKFRGFHLNAENTVCSLISGGFEAIGAGMYGAGVEFSRIMNRLTLDERRKGLDKIIGTVALFESTLKGYDHFHEVGGGLNLVYINGEPKSHSERYLELSDGITQLALEMIRARSMDLISYEQLYPLIDKLLFQGTPRKEVEKELFSIVTDQQLLNKLLRGYKFFPYPKIETKSDESTASNQSKGKKEGRK